MTDGDAIYPGSFDPFTNGHYEIVKQALPIFHKITLAVAVNPEKISPLFTPEVRRAFLVDVAVAHHQLCVGSYTIKGSNALYTVDYAEKVGARYIIRGLRNASDFEGEFAMAQINKKLNPRIRTVFFLADSAQAAVSSSMVRGLIGPRNWQEKIKEFIPEPMWERFITLVDQS